MGKVAVWVGPADTQCFEQKAFHSIFFWMAVTHRCPTYQLHISPERRTRTRTHAPMPEKSVFSLNLAVPGCGHCGPFLEILLKPHPLHARQTYKQQYGRKLCKYSARFLFILCHVRGGWASSHISDICLSQLEDFRWKP